MKWAVGSALVAWALGLWAGVRAWQSAADMSRIQLVVAVVIGANLVFALWMWSQARPGSADAVFVPTVVLVSAAILVNHLPRLLWPDAQSVQIGAFILSGLMIAAALITQVRRRRRLLQSRRPM